MQSPKGVKSVWTDPCAVRFARGFMGLRTEGNPKGSNERAPVCLLPAMYSGRKFEGSQEGLTYEGGLGPGFGG